MNKSNILTMWYTNAHSIQRSAMGHVKLLSVNNLKNRFSLYILNHLAKTFIWSEKSGEMNAHFFRSFKTKSNKYIFLKAFMRKTKKNERIQGGKSNATVSYKNPILIKFIFGSLNEISFTITLWKQFGTDLKPPKKKLCK